MDARNQHTKICAISKCNGMKITLMALFMRKILSPDFLCHAPGSAINIHSQPVRAYLL